MLHLRAGWQTQTKLKTSWYEILQNRDSQIETSSCVCARRGCPAADICSPVAGCQLWFLSHSSQIWKTPTARLQVWTLSANHARLNVPVELFQGKTWFLADVCQIGRFLHFCKHQNRTLEQCHTLSTCRHGMTHMAHFGPFIINQIMDIILY